MPEFLSQRRVAHIVLRARGIARLAELRAEGVSAATMSRMERNGEVLRLARGLYQLADAPLDTHHSLAEAAKRLPRGVVCLVSSLAFHDLTDQLPRQVWMAIGQKDWAPKADGVSVRLVRFTANLLADSIETHAVGGVPVKVFSVAKTVADCFRYRNKIGLPLAIEGLQEALRQSKATPDEIAKQAARGAVATVIRPYLEALTANG